MATPTPKRLSLVYATWCPHCVPLSTELLPKLAERYGVPFRTLDIDRPQEAETADRMVLEHGDWADDYLVPQLFLEWSDGEISHLLTGTPGPTDGTRAGWDRLLRAPVPTAPARRSAAPQ